MERWLLDLSRQEERSAEGAVVRPRRAELSPQLCGLASEQHATLTGLDEAFEIDFVEGALLGLGREDVSVAGAGVAPSTCGDAGSSRTDGFGAGDLGRAGWRLEGIGWPSLGRSCLGGSLRGRVCVARRSDEREDGDPSHPRAKGAGAVALTHRTSPRWPSSARRRSRTSPSFSLAVGGRTSPYVDLRSQGRSPGASRRGPARPRQPCSSGWNWRRAYIERPATAGSRPPHTRSPSNVSPSGNPLGPHSGRGRAVWSRDSGPRLRRRSHPIGIRLGSGG